MNDMTPADQPNKNNDLSLNEPKNKVQGMFQSLEMMVQQKAKGGLDITSFSPEQKDKLLDMMAKNEENAFLYHTKKLEVTKDLALAHITSTTVSQRTNRYVSLGAIAVISLITILILLFKDNYFIHWLTFITGLLGGFGFGKYSKDAEKVEKVKVDVDED